MKNGKAWEKVTSNVRVLIMSRKRVRVEIKVVFEDFCFVLFLGEAP